MSDPVREVLAAGRRREAFAACAQVPAWLIYGAGNKGRALAAFLSAPDEGIRCPAARP